MERPVDFETWLEAANATARRWGYDDYDALIESWEVKRAAGAQVICIYCGRPTHDEFDEHPLCVEVSLRKSV